MVFGDSIEEVLVRGEGFTIGWWRATAEQALGPPSYRPRRPVSAETRSVRHELIQGHGSLVRRFGW